MRIESKLCYFSERKAIVQVNGWVNDKSVGSALAEASTVESAEDKAISRLNNRLNVINNENVNKNENTDSNQDNNKNSELINSNNYKKLDLNNEPNDWSNDLAAIDLEIKRLNWTREDEIRFLEKYLGYKNRNKITKYNELIKYLQTLKEIKISNSSAFDKQDPINLIEESESILKDLSWDHKKGREYLLKEFNVATRKELNDEQLLLFVSKLKSIRNKSLSQ